MPSCSAADADDQAAVLDVHAVDAAPQRDLRLAALAEHVDRLRAGVLGQQFVADGQQLLRFRGTGYLRQVQPGQARLTSGRYTCRFSPSRSTSARWFGASGSRLST